MAFFARAFHRWEPGEIIEGIKRGTLDDDAIFDSLFPDWAKELSTVHWTPIPVAKQAARLLTQGRADARVLDVGSGVGKFCIIGALTSSGLFTGVEQRERFVEFSRELARLAAVDRAKFIPGNFLDLDWSGFNAVYLFNPFQENLPNSAAIDRTIPLNASLFDRYTQGVREKLETMAPGTRVVTYWGFGGKFLRSYHRISSTFCYRGVLDYWIRR